MNYLSQYFQYKNKILHAEDISIRDILFDTPYYCYSHQALIDNYRKIADALPNILICYAVKANSNLTIINTFAKQGAGADVVSEGEMRRAILTGIKKIVFSGVGKKISEIEFALRHNVYQINAESIAELDVINQVAKNLQIRAPISLRVNLDVDGETLDKISTARKGDKFGIDVNHLSEILAVKHSHLNLMGLSIHIGSQITNISVFAKAFQKLEEIIKHLQLENRIKRLDLGGGFAIPYQDGGEEFDYSGYNQLLSKFSQNYEIIIEPGRSLVGNSGVLVTKVLFIKHNNMHVVVDAGMNDMMRTALYDVYHQVIPVYNSGKDDHCMVDIVGPVCESTDTFAKGCFLPALQQEDLLAICTVGAYGSSMSNTYNSRPLIGEIIVKDDQYSVIRNRQTYDEMFTQENIIKL